MTTMMNIQALYDIHTWMRLTSIVSSKDVGMGLYMSRYDRLWHMHIFDWLINLFDIAFTWEHSN